MRKRVVQKKPCFFPRIFEKIPFSILLERERFQKVSGSKPQGCSILCTEQINGQDKSKKKSWKSC